VGPANAVSDTVGLGAAPIRAVTFAQWTKSVIFDPSEMLILRRHLQTM